MHKKDERKNNEFKKKDKDIGAHQTKKKQKDEQQ